MPRPLFDEFPALSAVVPHNPFAQLPTPVEPLGVAPYSWIKRDDLTRPDYGGNKIRKLEFILGDALRRGKKHVVTFGAIGTNHGVATALLCREAGLACTVLLFDQPVTPTVRKNLHLMHSLGARLIHTRSLPRTLMRFHLNGWRLDPSSYFLFAGGSGVAGTLGFVNAALELRDQIDAGELPRPSAIYCPVGSGSTLAGLTLGMDIAALPVKVVGVRVFPARLGPFPACTTDTVHTLMRHTRTFLMKNLRRSLPPPSRPVLLDDFYGDGYGMSTEEGRQAMEKFSGHGIELEPTYTAKAAAAFLRRRETGQGPVLYWHTWNSRETSALRNESIDALPASLSRML